MITVQLIQHISEIRRTDNDSASLEILDCECYGIQYFEQLQLLLEVESFYVGFSHLFFILFQNIQEAERLQFKNTTKFLAKKYFDIFLSKYPRLAPQKSILVIITCLRTAAKFNEVADVSELYTLEYCIEQSAGNYSKEDFIQCQLELLMALNFKLRMTSPYDFVVVKCLLPHLRQAMNILNSIIDFALSLPQLRVVSAQGIFFGALIYSCRQKNQDPLSYNIIQAITYKWDQAIQIARILDENLRRLLQE